MQYNTHKKEEILNKLECINRIFEEPLIVSLPREENIKKYICHVNWRHLLPTIRTYKTEDPVIKHICKTNHSVKNYKVIRIEKVNGDQTLREVKRHTLDTKTKDV